MDGDKSILGGSTPMGDTSLNTSHWSNREWHVRIKAVPISGFLVIFLVWVGFISTRMKHQQRFITRIGNYFIKN